MVGVGRAIDKNMNDMIKGSYIGKLNAFEALRVARVHQSEGDMASSAKSSADDAESLCSKGEYDFAYRRALDSLAYSVGKFAKIYAYALRLAHPYSNESRTLRGIG